MEIAVNVRDFLVGMKETITTSEEEMLSNLQDLHEQFTEIMNGFEDQVSAHALSMSPEARIVAHELRVRMYQDWRAKLTEYVFLTASSEDVSNEDADNAEKVEEKESQYQRDSLMSSIKDRLELFQSVVNDYIQVSTQVRTKRPILAPAVSSPTSMNKRPLDSDVSDFESDSFIFEIPHFLCGPTLNSV
ncbi:hypothetical protein ABG067_003113 [Albugo candida]|uniref:Uncharacterized protein n=2 Tax=Albugo candida TaxID=65357 RepID=A0A024GMP4_9STRA|nr:unnamed protein product [Albugo candida]|eukprot:CCI47974.1 unnamed protein product [Albugo candida]